MSTSPLKTREGAGNARFGLPSFDSLFSEDITDFVLQRLEKGERAAVVTLVGVDGSSPRPLGAQMGVAADESVSGYLSGGCLEGAVLYEALEAIAAGANRLVRYGKGSRYIDIALPCGSAIDLYFDVGIEAATLREVRRAAQERRAISTVIDIAGGKSAALTNDAGPTRREDGMFWRRFTPATQLVVAGSGPNALYLARLASFAGVRTRLLSPDEQTIALAAPYVEEAVQLKSPTAQPKLDADANTAVAIVFHDHDWEPRILAEALDSDAFYLGAMGSARTHAARLRTLAEMGYAQDVLQRIRGPAGLSRHARTAPEIAASILSEIFDAARALERGA